MSRLITRHLLNTPSPPPPTTQVLSSNAEQKLVLILAALICGLISLLGLVAMARCAWLRQSFTRSSTSSAANRGLKKKVLQALPKYTYSHDIINSIIKFVSSSGAECPICLGELVEGDEIRVLPQCGHCFHVECIDTWLGSHSSCPSCRQILVASATCHKCGHGISNCNTSVNTFLP